METLVQQALSEEVRETREVEAIIEQINEYYRFLDR
ncbi:hypothetical protein EDD64_10710 [Effusibacillus lacus]|nr:hypothetical protein EDD64_10710 [Effusibacillus lacus]